MKHIVTTPKGIDVSIANAQDHIYTELKTLWGIDNDVDYDCFGRAYSNPRNGKKVPEVYTTGIDYKEVLYNDMVKATSFFDVGEDITIDSGYGTASIHLIFMLNLDNLKDIDTHREDEEVRIDVYNTLENFGQFKVNGITMGVGALRGFSGAMEAMKFKDMHPYHIFSIDCEVRYRINQCNYNAANPTGWVA